MEARFVRGDTRFSVDNERVQKSITTFYTKITDT